MQGEFLMKAKDMHAFIMSLLLAAAIASLMILGAKTLTENIR